MATQSAGHFELDCASVLVALFELILCGGMSRHRLSGLCTVCIDKAEVKVRRSTRERTGELVIAALVLDAWHRDRRYLNAYAAPKAVPLLGPAPSVQALIRAQRVGCHAEEVARRLRALRLVVRSGKGRYKPTSDVAIISAQNPVVLQHTTRALAALLQTVGQNMNSHPDLGPLIERKAEIPDLPQKHVSAFKRFTQLQGTSFLRTVNDWLEARREPGLNGSAATKQGSVRAGVHTYAYVAASRRLSP